MHGVATHPTFTSSDLQIGLARTELGTRAPQPTSLVEHGGLDVEKEKNAFCKQEGQIFIDDNATHHRSPATLLTQLKNCAGRKDLRRGSSIHTEIVRRGLLQHDVFLGSALISMYAKCHAIEKAQEVFDELPSLSVVSWNALITGYAQHKKAKEALFCYEEMQRCGFSPDSYTFSCILKACSILGALDKGREIHAQIMQQPLEENDLVVANALVDMYAKCGALLTAHDVLDKLCPESNISWNSLIGGYAQHGLGEKALSCFLSMQERGLSPDAATFFCALKACSSIGDCDRGQEIHVHIMKLGMLENHVALGTALVDMYAKCCILEDAKDVFDQLPARDAISWNTLISGYAQFEYGKEALTCFQRMQLEGVFPTAVTYSCILNACGSIRQLDKGQELHARLLREQFLRKDVVLSTGLVDMYAKCGALVKAQQVFDELLVRDIVLWNGLIAGYSQQGLGEDALCCFERMQVEGFTPDEVTFECALNACGSIADAERGRDIHDQVEKGGFLNKESRLAKALVDMYCKCGDLQKAQELFDKLYVRDADSWNALIAGYAQHEYCEEALYFFHQMQHEGLSPIAGTFSCILKACGSMGTLCEGQKFHADYVRSGMVDVDMVTSTALISMYANCGMIREAQELFDDLSDRDVVSWSALMEGYTQLGNVNVVFDLVEQMQAEHVEPNSVTFTIVLSACSHTGLVGESQAYLELLSRVYGIFPSIEHHNCLVDLLGRAGQLDELVETIKEMPFSVSTSIWHTLLGACRNMETSRLGRWAFEYATQLDGNNAAAYVSLENIICG